MQNAAFPDGGMKMVHSMVAGVIYLFVQWFRQKANEWRNGLGIASTRQDKGLKM